MKRGIIYPISKIGDPNCGPNDVRPLTFLEQFGMKLVTRIINDRIMKVLIEKRILNEDQHAGRPGTSTNEAIYKMIATIEEAAERGQRIYATQIDMSKAFDSVPHWSIRLSLRRLDIPAE